MYPSLRIEGLASGETPLYIIYLHIIEPFHPLLMTIFHGFTMWLIVN
jgi:hypothetical protein